MHYFLQKHFRCVLFAMMVLKCLKYDWNHFEKDNTLMCNVCRASLSATQSFSSLHRFYFGFRSGDWLGHSRTLKCFLRSYSLVALAVCLGSLSCWKTQPRPIFNALTEGRRLLAKILRYMAPSILPSIRCSRPVPFAETHPQSMMCPPPCFTVGMLFLGLYSSFLFLQTRRVKFLPLWSL